MNKEKSKIQVSAVVLLFVWPALAFGSDGLVAHWTFDEGSGSVAYDSTGAYNGTVYGAQWTDGVFDGALYFDGVDDYVALPDNDPIWLPENDFTLSIWAYFNRPPAAAYEELLDLNYGMSAISSRELGYGIHRVGIDGTLAFRMTTPTNSDEDLFSNTIPLADDWYHIVGLRDGTTQAIYIDGQLDANRTCSPDPIDFVGDYDDDRVQIGRLTVSGVAAQHHLHGRVDDVRIYNSALSDVEIEQLYGVEPNLVAHWAFDEGTGSVAYDSAGSNHGTIYGAAWTDGILGGALDFDGDLDYVEVPDDDSLTPSDEMTLAFWLYNRGTTEKCGIYKYASCPEQASSPGNSRAYVFQVFNDTGKLRFKSWASVNNEDYVDSSSSVPFNEWQHLAATFNRGDSALYIDGQIDNTKQMSMSSIMNDAQPLTIGGYWYYCGTNQFTAAFDGKADDVRIYNRALSPIEIEQLYEASAPQPPQPTVYYVDGVNGDDLNDGLTLETAFATIQAGIDAGADGNTVLVYPAVYTQAIDFDGKAVTVQGVATAAGVPVLETPTDFAASFYTGETADSVLTNFVIRSSEIAVFIADASPTLSNLTIVDNDSGISAYGASDPDISNCIFYNNLDGDLYKCQARHSWLARDTNAPTTAGLLGHWAFDEAAGSTAYDSAGIYNGTVYGAQWTDGVFDGALYFDGINDYVALPDNDPIWLPENDFTLSVWAYFNRPAATVEEELLDLNYALSSISSREVGYGICRVDTDGSLAFRMTTTSNSDEDLFSNTVPVAGDWYHIVGLRHGTIQAIYLDGQLDANRTCSPDPIDFVGDYDDGRVQIGTYTVTGITPRHYLQGNLDDVRIYNRGLSDPEIQGLFTNQGVEDPGFVDAPAGDYHLLSERGRYWPAYDVWVVDDMTSPCVDGGDPNINPADEPGPNGGRINMGAYGATPYASMSDWSIPQDYNRDGIVNWVDFAMLADRWLETLPWAR